MSFRHALTIAATAIALAPSSALAQGAGDDQYTTAQATPVPAGPQATATPVPAGPTLPYTGVDAWPLALGGALLLGSGIALRVRLRDQD